MFDLTLMGTSALALVLITIVAIAFALLLAFRAELTRSRGGKILAFIALCILPVFAVWAGVREHLDRSTSPQFCLSCHVMSDFGQSLYVDDKSYLPAAHFQNNLVPRDHACFTCHTDYTMFGDYRSKWRVLHHVYVQYFGKVPKPTEIKLYTTSDNPECF